MVSNILSVNHPMPMPRVPAARREAEQPKLTARRGGSQLMLPFAPRTSLHKQRAHYMRDVGLHQVQDAPTVLSCSMSPRLELISVTCWGPQVTAAAR